MTTAHQSQIVLLDLTDVIAAAQEVLPLFNNDTVWWRGHAKAESVAGAGASAEP